MDRAFCCLFFCKIANKSQLSKWNFTVHAGLAIVGQQYFSAIISRKQGTIYRLSQYCPHPFRHRQNTERFTVGGSVDFKRGGKGDTSPLLSAHTYVFIAFVIAFLSLCHCLLSATPTRGHLGCPCLFGSSGNPTCKF